MEKFMFQFYKNREIQKRKKLVEHITKMKLLVKLYVYLLVLIASNGIIWNLNPIIISGIIFTIQYFL